jgi:hypothetical protein
MHMMAWPFSVIVDGVPQKIPWTRRMCPEQMPHSHGEHSHPFAKDVFKILPALPLRSSGMK